MLERAASLPGYGGAYIDQLRDGSPVLLATDPPAMVAALGDHLVGEQVEVRAATYSLDELYRVKVAAERDVASMVADHLILAVGIDIVANRVIVEVLGEPSPDATRSLVDKYGPAVAVREGSSTALDSCTNMTSCWPMKGGLRIRLVSNTNKICTSGYLARRTDTSAPVLVTAGHCLALANSTGTDYWGHSSSPSSAVNVGWELGHTWWDNSLADVGLIQLESDSVSALSGVPKNTVHSSDPSTNEPVLSHRNPSYQLPGDAVCRMGWGTWNATGQGRTCGQVDTLIDATLLSCESGLTVNCKNIQHQWRVTFDSLPGDSGGPVTFKSYGSPYPHLVAYGTHVHSGSGAGAKGWYSPVSWGSSAYNSPVFQYSYRICTSSSC